MSKSNTVPNDRAKVKGFFRLAIENSDGSIAGDSGWVPNQITNLGFNNFLCGAFAQLAGSLQVGTISIGSGGAAAVADTSMGGEISTAKRIGVTAASSAGSKGVLFTATFNSANSFLAGASNLSNVGLFGSNTTSPVFAVAAYASSACATNQNVNVSYAINFT
jgi:hypothetical protein